MSMAMLAAGDRRIVTAGNLAFVSGLTNMDCARDGWLNIKAALPVQEVPEGRLGLLDGLMRERASLESEGRDTKRIVALLSSLCST